MKGINGMIVGVCNCHRLFVIKSFLFLKQLKQFLKTNNTIFFCSCELLFFFSLFYVYGFILCFRKTSNCRKIWDSLHVYCHHYNYSNNKSLLPFDNVIWLLVMMIQSQIKSVSVIDKTHRRNPVCLHIIE